VPHPKWDERPILKRDLIKYFDGKVAKWWIPDDIIFVPEIPHSATRKIQKTELSKQFKEFRLQERNA
jgi:fatty-acyl-CoA synthase